MKYIPFRRKTTVTCTRERDSDKKVVPFVSLTDEGNMIFVQVHNDDDSTSNRFWFRVSKESFLGMVGSLFPEEIAVMIEDADA